MKAFSCFVIICGILVSSDLAFGFSFGVRQLESEDKSDGKVAPPAEANSEVLKKVEHKIALMKEALIRDINNQESAETALVQNLRNSTSKQLKIVDGKVIQTEEKIVSIGTKDNATIAIYKLINVRPLSSVVIESESEKSNSDSNQLSEQTSDISDKSDKSDKSSDEPQVESENPNSKNAQPAENESSPSVTTQNNQSVQQNQPAQNKSAPRAPVFQITGPDGIARRVRGIAIKLSPKNDKNEGKNIAFRFFKK